MKASQAFAAFRTSLITDKNHVILTELVPIFNSCCEDIRRKVDEDFNTYHNQAKSDNLRKTLIYDLVLYRKQILDTVQNSMAKAIKERLQKDNATVEEEIIESNERPKHVLTAKFPDGSAAKVPQKLWIDYTMFERV